MGAACGQRALAELRAISTSETPTEAEARRRLPTARARWPRLASRMGRLASEPPLPPSRPRPEPCAFGASQVTTKLSRLRMEVVETEHNTWCAEWTG